MRGRLVSIGQGQVCRARLDFLSLLQFMAVVGACAGIVSVPIFLLIQSEKWLADPFTALFIVVAAPITGVLNGILFGVVGYPLYRWITRRVDVHTYTGEFEVSRRDAEEI